MTDQLLRIASRLRENRSMSPSRELAIVTTVVSAPIAILGGLVVGTPAVLGASITAALLYGIAGFMRWMDGK